MSAYCIGNKYRVMAAVMIVLTLLAGCKTAEPTPAPILPTVTPALPEATPVPPTETSTPGPLPTPTLMPVEEISDVPYAGDENPKQRLDIYLPEGRDGPLPTLFVIHGGGGDKRDLAYLARYFAQRGYAVVSINHRTMPQNIYPTQIQDVFCALAWVHANAGTHGFDPGFIVALGHSSGGTFAATLGAVDDPTPYMEGCPHSLPQSGWIRGVIPFTGIFDYTDETYRSSGLLSYYIDYFGAEPDEAPKIWAEASPVTWLDGSEPPFLLIHGEKDRNIDPGYSIDFAAALEEAGVEVKLLLIPDADHGVIIRSEQSFEAVEDFLATLAEQGAPTSIPSTATSTPTPDDKQVLFIIQEHFNASEYGDPRTLLEERGWNAIVASSSLDMVTAYGQAATAQPDILLNDVHAVDYDAIVFVGGYPYDPDVPEMHRIAQEAVAEGKLVAGICNGVIAMANAGILEGKQVTTLIYHPDSKLESKGAILTEATVERDGLIITGNGPDASASFGEAIVAALEE